MSTCNFEFFLPPQQAWSYIHVYMCIQIKLVHCSTLCNLVLYGEKRMYSHVARLKILFFVFVLCSWNDPKGKRIWGLVSICSLLFFFTIYFVLVYKSKKSILLLDNVSRAELLQACVCVIYAKCELRNCLRTRTRARTLF